MGSARRTGTNENISTYGDVTRDYQEGELSVWESATDNDLVTATQSEVLEVYDDASDYDDYVTLSGATANASYRRIIRPASGEEHDGTPNNGVFFSSTTDAPLIRIDEDYPQIQDLILKLAINSSNNRLVVGGPGAFYGIVGCLIYNSDNAGSGIVNGVWMWGASGTRYCIDCLIHNNTNHGIYVTGTSYHYFYNCTITGNSDKGMYSYTTGTGYAHRKNCISYNNGTDTSGDWTTTTCLIGGSPVFIDSANDDFHLSLSDTEAKDQGTDLSGDGIYPFNDDIDFDTIVSWPIGFDYPLSGGEQPRVVIIV